MATPTSYLQTLSRNDAIAFIESLQRVKSHLSGELEWLHQQVQQKTIQLQGIETLISEAIELGLATAEASSTSEAVSLSSVETKHLITEAIPSREVEPDASDEFDNVVDNGNGVSHHASTGAGSTPIPSTAPAPKPAATKAKSNSKNPKKPSTPSKPKAQTASTNQASSSTVKKVSQPQKLTSKVSKPSNTRELKYLLLPKFEGKTLTDAVAQILKDAAKPLHLNELMNHMYGKLSAQDFKRAKVSLANVLSVGKKEGKWQNLGEGLYAANQGAK